MIVVLVLKMTWRLEVCLPLYHSKYWSAIEMQLVFSLVDEMCYKLRRKTNFALMQWLSDPLPGIGQKIHFLPCIIYILYCASCTRASLQQG